MKKIILSEKILILVEGKDEEIVFKNLIKEEFNNYLKNIQILNYTGKNNFKKTFPVLKNISGFEKIETIMIFRDADDSFGDAFLSIKDVIIRNGFSPPERHGSYGKGIIKIGIFILPNLNQNGMLEDLFLECNKDTQKMILSNEFINKVIEVVNTEDKPKVKSKAISRAYLATLKEDIKDLGIASEKNYWNFQHACFDELKIFIKKGIDI